jgi:hypothetical protein
MRALLVFAALAGAARAAPVPLETLPPDRLKALAPLLANTDLALIESKPNGRMRQVTILTLVAAPPELVREVVATPEKYPEFVRNLKRAHVIRYPEGLFDVDFAVDYRITSFESINRFRTNPDGSIDEWGMGTVDDNTFRWEFVPAPGGTVVAYYGYTDIAHTNTYIRSITDRIPSMEHGLAVSAQLVFPRSVKRRAEGLAKPGSFTPVDKNAKAPGFDFLLKRGRVALIRSAPNGRLSDISIVDRAQVGPEKIRAALRATSAYSTFIEGVRESRELSRTDTDIVYETVAEAPIFSWVTRFRLHDDGHYVIEVLGVEGDLKDAHYRFDLTPVDGGAATTLVFRSRQNLGAASPLLFGTLFRIEPLFEHGLAVAMGLVQVVAFRGRAEGKR